jgi:solute carrier family 35 protein F5
MVEMKMIGTSLLFGDVLALTSAIFYALYITLLKVRIQDESRINMPLFFGFVGLFNIFPAPPVYVLLHFTGIETLEWPNVQKAWFTILANVSGKRVFSGG